MQQFDDFSVPTIQGVEFFEPDMFERSEGLVRRVTIAATQSGGLENRAGGLGAGALVARTPRGAAIAATRLYIQTDANLAGRIQAELLDVLAQPALHLATIAVPGAGSGVTGGVAVSAQQILTSADTARDMRLILAGQDGAGQPALRLRADDATRLVTLAGPVGQAGVAASGFAAALDLTQREVTGAIGPAFEVIYDQPLYADLYGNRPIVFDDMTVFDPFAPAPQIDAASISATNSGAVITAAVSGEDDTGGTGSVADPLRPVLQRAGGVNLTDLSLLQDWTIDSPEAPDYVAEVLGGLRFAAAFAGNAGRSIVTAYVAPRAEMRFDGDLDVTARDAAQVVALTGGLVSPAAQIGVAGGFAVSATTRMAAVRMYGGAHEVGGAVTVLADMAARDVAVGSSAAGGGLTGAGLAASGAVLAGTRDALVRLGSVNIAAVDAVTVLSQDTGETSAMAGSVEAGGTAGIGLAAAADLTLRTARVDLARFDGRPDQNIAPPDPVVHLSTSDGPVRIEAQGTGTARVIARSAGAGTLGAAGAVAVSAAERRAALDVTAALALPQGAVLLAQAEGLSLTHAGADASQTGTRGLGLGVATAVQTGARDAVVDLRGAILSQDGTTTIPALGHLQISAVVDGKLTASAVAGAQAGGEDLAANGAVAVNAAQQQATILLHNAADRTTQISAETLNLTAQIASTAERSASAGSQTEAGEAVGFGLGLALDLGNAAADIAATEAQLSGTQAVVLEALADGAVVVEAKNGMLAGDTVAGVNLAGGLSTARSGIALTGGTVSAPVIDISATTQGDYNALADSTPVSDAASPLRAVASVAALAVDAQAAVDLRGAVVTSDTTDPAGGWITIEALTNPAVITRSANVDALRIDFAQAAALLDENGTEIRPAMRNLDLAVAATGIAADATVLLDDADLQADRITVSAFGFATADSVGLVAATTDLTVQGNALLRAREGMVLTSAAYAAVVATDTLTSARGAALRAAEDRHADLAEDAAAANASEDPEDSVDFAATIAPEAALADAALNVTNAALIVTGADESLNLSSLASTDVTLGAAGSGLAATVAVTQTNARTRIKDSLLAASGSLSVSATVNETQSLTARAAADGNGVAGVVSIRRSAAVVDVDNGVSLSGLSGGAISLRSERNRNLTFDVAADMGATGDAAIAALVSFGDAVTTTQLSGDVVAGEGAGNLSVAARTVTLIDARVNAALGGPDAGAITTGLPPLGTMADRLRQIAAQIELRNLPDAQIKGVTDYAASARLALGVLAVGQIDTVTAKLGREGAAPSSISAGTVRVEATARHPFLRLRNSALLGLPAEPDAPARQFPATAALSVYGQRGRVSSLLETGATVTASHITIEALTAFPDIMTGIPSVTGAADLRALGDRGIISPDALVDDPGTDMGGDWTLDQSAKAAPDAALYAVDAALFVLDLSTIADLSGTANAATVDLLANTTGAMTLRAGGTSAQTGEQGKGAGIAAMLLREVTEARITRTAQNVGFGNETAARATSALSVLALGQYKAQAAQASFNGGLGLVGTGRHVLATLDPRARFAGSVTLDATDRSDLIAAGLASAGAGGLSVGLSGALVFGDSQVEVLYGARDADGVLLDITGADITPTDLTMTARDDSLIAAVSTAGAGTVEGQPLGGFSLTTAYSALIGTSSTAARLTAVSDAVADGGWFGLGASGAFAGAIGQSNVQAILHGIDLDPGFLQASAIDASDVVILAGGSLTGARVNGAAGAGAVMERHAHVTTKATGLTTSAPVDLTAQSQRVVTVAASGAKGKGLSLLALAGSVAQDRSHNTVTADLVLARLGSSSGNFSGAVSVTAQTQGRMRLLAGGVATGPGFVAGVSSAENHGSVTTLARILNAPLIRAARVEVTAQTSRDVVIRARSSANAGIAGLVNLAAAQALDMGTVSATAAMTGGTVLARDKWQLAATGGGDTDASAMREDLAVITAGQAGGVRAEHDATRVVLASALGGQFALEESAPDGATFAITAQDGGTLEVGSAAFVQAIAPGAQININITEVVRHGEVAARLGTLMLADPATAEMPTATALGVFAPNQTAQITATDARNVDLLPITITNAVAGGLSAAATIVNVDDRRAVRAEMVDVLVLGVGQAAVSANRTGAIDSLSLLGGVNLAGFGAVTGNIVVLSSSGEVAARALGTQLFFTTGFAGLSATATDQGMLRATAAELSYANLNIGLRATQIDLKRNVVAEVGDSASRIMALPVTGAITATALGESLVSAPGFVASGGLTADAGIVIAAISAERDVFAAAGGPVTAQSVAVSSTRRDTLRVVDVDLSVSAALAMTLRTVVISQGGATEALLRTSGASNVAGAASVTALDASTILAATVAGSVSPAGVGAVGDITVVVLGGRDTPPEREDDAALRSGYAAIQAAEAQAGTALGEGLGAISATSNPFTRSAPSGSTIARIEAADLAADAAAEFGISQSGRVDIGGPVTVSATTDVDVSAITGQVSAATGPAITVGAAVLSRRTRTQADLDLGGLSDGVFIGGDLSARAVSTGQSGAIGIGVAAGGAGAGAGSLAFALDNRSADVTLTGANIRANAINFTADSGGSVGASALNGGSGATVGVGVGIAMALDSRDAKVTVTNSVLTTTTTDLSRPLTLRSRSEGDTFAVAFAAGVGGQAGIAVASAFAVRDGQTLTSVTDSTLTAARSVVIEAVTDGWSTGATRPSVTTVIIPIGGAGGIAVAAGLGGAFWEGTTEARVSSSTITAGRDLYVDARANADVLSLSIGASVGAQSGIAGSYAVSIRRDTVSALLQGGTTTAQGSVLVLAQTTTGSEAFAGGATSGDEDETADPPLSSVPARLATLNVNIGVGGVFGGGLSFALTTISNTVTAAIDQGATVLARSTGASAFGPGFNVDPSVARDTAQRSGVVVVADSFVAQTSLSLVAGASGIAAGAVQVNQLSLRETVAARIGGTGARTAVTTQGNGRLVVEGRASARLNVINMGVAGAGKVGVGAVVNTLNLTRDVTAQITHATVTSNNSLTVAATVAERLNSVDLAGGGGFFAGVAGAVSVINAQHNVAATIGRSIISTRNATSVTATLNRSLLVVTGGAGLGIGVGTGGVQVTDLRDVVLAEVSDAANPLTDQTQVAAGSLEIRAQTTQDISVQAGTLAAGVGAIQGVVSVLMLDTDVRARFGTHAIFNTRSGASGNVTVTASTLLEPRAADEAMLSAGQIAIVGFGYGATVGVLSARAVTEAEIARNARVTSDGTVNVSALTDRAMTAEVGAFGLALGGTVQILTVFSLLGDSTGGANGLSFLSSTGQSLSQDDTLDSLAQDDPSQNAKAPAAFTEGEQTRRGAGTRLVALTSATVVPQDRDRIVARIGTDAVITAQGAVFVTAQDVTLAGTKAGGLGLAGGLSAIAGVAQTRVNSTILAEMQTGAQITSGAQTAINASLGIEGRRSITRADAYAGTVGLVGGAAAIASSNSKSSRVVLARTESGATISAGGAAQVQALQNADVTSATSGFAIGTVAASVMSSATSDTSRTEAIHSGTVSAASLVVAARNAGQGRAHLDALGLSLGFTGGVLGATVTEASSTLARIAGSANVTGTTSLEARNSRTLSSEAKGVAISALFAIGGSTARITATRTILAELTGSAQITARDLAVTAAQTDATYAARAKNGGGALGIGIMGSTAALTVSGSVQALAQAGRVTLQRNATIAAENEQALTAEADSTGIGVLGAGGAADAVISVDMDSAAETFTAGTVTGQLTVTARADELLTASATGAAGGLVGVAGATSTITSRSDTIAAINSRNTGAMPGLSVGRLVMQSDHLSRFVPNADSTAIAGVSLGGAVSMVDIVTDSGIRLRAGARITARDVDLRAQSRLSRIINGRAALAGSGGGLGAVGAKAVHDLTNRNDVAFASGATLRQTGSTGGVAITASSTTIATPSATATTIEAISLPRTDAASTVVNQATVTLGTSAALLAQGHVTVNTATIGRVVSNANADTVSAGSRISATAEAHYTARERIALQTGAQLDGGRGATLQTGSDGTARSTAEVAAGATYRSRSVVPLDRLPVARITLDLASVIDIGAGAQANAGGKMSLLTGSIEADALVTAVGRNLWREGAEGVINTVADALGVDGRVDLDVIGIETATLTDNTGVTVNGIVRSGTQANRSLVYDALGVLRVDGQIVTPENAGLPVTITSVNAATLRNDILTDLLAERATYLEAGLQDRVRVLDLQIAEVTAALDLLVAQSPTGVVDVLRLDDIVLEGANIDVAGGYLKGAGQLRPTTDIQVVVSVQKAGAVLLLEDIFIPDQPGIVRLNGQRVRNAAEINGANAVAERNMFSNRDWQIAAPAPLVLGWDTTPATLSVVSAANAMGGRVDVAVTDGDLFATGRITNRAGNVSLSALNTLYVQGNITAQTVDLNARNVIVGLTPGLRNIAGDPQARLFDRADGPGLTDNEVIALASAYRNFAPSDLAQDDPAILAQNVSIYGEYVNVNGRIEAGGPELSVTIGAQTDNWINTVIRPALDGSAPARIQIHSPFRPDPESGITGNIPVYYNPATDRIEFDPIISEGGRVSIAGQIISTGNGEIVALDGFSDISVTSASTRVLRFDRIDTGGENGVQGQVELLDLRRGQRTVYSGIDTPLGAGATRREIRREVYTLPSTGNLGSASAIRGDLLSSVIVPANIFNGQRADTYQIATIGGRVPFIRYEVETTQVRNPQTQIWSQGSRFVFDPTVVERNFAGSSFYDYTRTPSDLTATGATSHTHSFRANEPISVELRGNRTGSIAVAAAGTVEFSDLVRSEGAGLSVTASGSILGIGGSALLRGAQISLVSTGAGAISAGADAIPATAATVNGAAVSLTDLLSPATDLTAVANPAVVSIARLRSGSVFQGLLLQPERPETPLQLHLTDPRNLIAAGVTALAGTAVNGPRGNIALEARETSLSLTRIDGRAVSLSSGLSILRSGGSVGAGINGLEVKATRDLTLTAGTGGIGSGAVTSVTPFAIRFDIADGRLRAAARANIDLAHAPQDAVGRRVLRLDSITSTDGGVSLTSQGRILDDNGEGFRNRVTEEQALADFWTSTGLLGEERTARITAENEAQRAARQAEVDLYWRIREGFDGQEPTKLQEDTFFAAIENAAIAAGLTSEQATQEVTRLQDAYQAGKDRSRAADPTATERPDIEVVLTDAEINEIALDLTVTAAELDVALRSDYALATTDTEIEVERPNISAQGNITIRAAALGEDRLVARLLTAASAPVSPLAGVTDYDITDGVPRDLLVLLATSEPSDIVLRGFPSSRRDIFQSQDVDLQTTGVVNVLLHTGQAQSNDVSAYIGSEGNLRFNQVAARDQTRIKVAGSILSATQNAPGLSGNRVVLEASLGQIGTAAQVLRLTSGTANGPLTLDARAGGNSNFFGDIHLRRATTGDVVIGGVLAQNGAAVLDVAAGNMLARDEGSFIEARAITLTASGTIGRPVAAGATPKLALRLDSPQAVTATAGSGLFIRSDDTLRVKQVGSTTGRVELQVDAGDLILTGPLNDPDNPASLQIAPALFADPVFTGISTGPNDMILNVQNGRVLDRGSDTPTAGNDPFIVPDISAGRLFLFTGGFGEADNPIETDLGYIGGNASAGLHLVNDRRQQTSINRDMVLGNLSAMGGSISARQRDGFALAPNVTIRARDEVRLGMVGGSALSLQGNATLNAPDVVIDTPFSDLSLLNAQTGNSVALTVGGNLTVTARRVLDGPSGPAPLSPQSGTITASGDIDITASNGLALRRVNGRNVALTAVALDIDGGLFGPAASVALEEVNATQSVTIRATGDSRTDFVTATGDVLIDIGGNANYASLTLQNLSTQGIATVRTSALANGGLVRVAARRLTGTFGDLQPATTLRLQGEVQLRDFRFGGAFGPAATLQSLGGPLSLVDDITFGDIRIEALSVLVDGATQTGNLDMVAVDGLTLAKGAHLSGDTISITTGALGSDFAPRPADVRMDPDARITAFGQLGITASGAARITGLQSMATVPADGIGIDILAASIVEAGDTWIDLTTATGVAARLRAQSLTLDEATGMETQLGALDVVVSRGDIAIRQVGNLILQQARTESGRIDIFTFGDLLLQGRQDQGGKPVPTVSSKDTVVLTADGSIFTTAAQRQPVITDARALFLGAIEGSVGTQAAPLDLTFQDLSPDSLSVFAGRHIVGQFAYRPLDLPLLAADTGLIDVIFAQGAQPGIVSAPGRITADGLGAFRPLPGVYDTRPTVALLLEEPRYPLRGLRREGDPAFDPEGLGAVFGDPLKPRQDPSDGVIPEPDQPVLTPTDSTGAPAGGTTPEVVTALRDRAEAIALAAKRGESLPGAPLSVYDNPLQPFGSLLNQLRLSGAALRQQEDAPRPRPVVTVSEELKK